jgi:GNAT superfamily N-acetyltransferase
VTEIERIEHAMYATANRLGGGSLTWTDDWVQLTTPDAMTDYRNLVYRSILPDQDVDARIEEMIRFHEELGVAFRWWVTPSTRPVDMGRRLEAHGFVQVDDVEGMVADAASFPEPASADITVEKVGMDTAEAWLDATCRGWDTPPAARERFRMEVERELCNPDTRCHYFLARWRGEPAGSGGLTYVDDFAHFSGSVVIKEFRRRGVYGELILERMRHVREAGLRVVTNTCVKTTSAPICAARGFRGVCEMQVFRHAGGAE